MEEVEKGKTAKYLRDKIGVSEQAKENLKEFTRIKKSITDALAEGDMTIDQLTTKLSMPKPDVVYYLMSLVKYGVVKTGDIDDMDEYYTYKLNK
jgi:Bacterial regulatory protein, arsR family